MSISLANVTGDTMGVFTTPGYTVTADTPPPGVKGKQYAISALTGTQTGVEANAIGEPFSFTYSGPVSPKGVGALSSATGRPLVTPRNTHKCITRKGVEVVTGYFVPMNITTTFDVPAGSEIKDSESIRAAINLHVNAMKQIVSGLGDTIVTGVI